MNGEQQANPRNTAPKAPADDRCPEVLRYMRDDLAEILAGQGVDPDGARLAAYTATEHIRERFGGMYLPKGLAMNLNRRDREIGKRWNGANKLALCQEYGITEQRLYQILARLRTEKIANRQHDQF
jgi:Mor family transcriptional regulator